MKTQRPACERLPRRVVILAAAALLVASLPLAAQERSRPSSSSDTGRTAHEVGSAPAQPSSSPSAPSHTSSSSDSGSSSADSGRTAHPSGGGGEASDGPHRQPPTHGTDGHHGGGGHYGGYYGGYGSYYPYYYPYGYYAGYWPGLFGWWWGDYYYYPPPYPYGYGYGAPSYYGHGDVGALDLDVSPGRTEVYVDGQYLGKVDAFDGWPRYLWLPKGTYDVAFYLDGYKTIARQITVYPGSVLGVDDHMEPGESVRPENLATKTHERRDERLRYERERSDRIDRGKRGDADEDWHDRVQRERGANRERDVEERPQAQDHSQQDHSQRGYLRLDVVPEDASVYLDGRFVGTGSDLSSMRNGLPVPAGDHRLAIVRPGRKAEERQFQVKPGENVELDVELEETSGR